MVHDMRCMLLFRPQTYAQFYILTCVLNVCTINNNLQYIHLLYPQNISCIPFLVSSYLRCGTGVSTGYSLVPDSSCRSFHTATL